jgi:hypothetical protein
MVAEEANALAGASWEGSLSWAAGAPSSAREVSLLHGASVSGYVRGCVSRFCSVLCDGILLFFDHFTPPRPLYLVLGSP